MRKKADFHNLTMKRYEDIVLKYLNDCESLQTALGFGEKIRKTLTRLKTKKMTSSNKPLNISERIIKLEIMTQAEIDLLEHSSMQSYSLASSPIRGKSLGSESQIRIKI